MARASRRGGLTAGNAGPAAGTARGQTALRRGCWVCQALGSGGLAAATVWQSRLSPQMDCWIDDSTKTFFEQVMFFFFLLKLAFVVALMSMMAIRTMGHDIWGSP